MSDDLLRRWVDTWRHAAPRLEAIRIAELQAVDTQAAVRQLYGDGGIAPLPPGEPTSGLIEQQAWFARLRARRTP